MSAVKGPLACRGVLKNPATTSVARLGVPGNPSERAKTLQAMWRSLVAHRVGLRCDLDRVLARHGILGITGLVVGCCGGLEVVLVDAPTHSVLRSWLDDYVVRLVCEALGLGANQRWRNELALTVLEA